MRLNKRIEEEKVTVEKMVRLYCRKNHGSDLCESCKSILDYAIARLEHCPQASAKPTCTRCSIHCYHPDMRKAIGKVMRYSGPRMLLYHPFMAIRHLYRDVKSR